MTGGNSVRERPRRLALRGSRFFDGLTLRPDPVVVVLDGPVIDAVIDGTTPPADAELIDLPGATLLPGLIDTHVHLAFDASADPVVTLADRDDGAVRAAMTVAARTAVAGGVTTVRDLGDRDYLSLGLRDQPGLPRILAAGPPITTFAGHCYFLGGAVADDADAVRAAVRDRAERGCDVVKVMSSGGTMTPGTRQQDPQFQREVLAAAVDEAHRLGLPLTAHAHGTSAIENCIAAGVDGMEHVTFWSAEGVDAPEHLMRAIADRGIAVGATVGLLPAPPGHTPPPAIMARLPQILAAMRHLAELGSVMVVGTDAGIAPVKPHDIVRTAVGQLADIGIGPLEALRITTSRAAQVLGLGERTGRLAAGYDADILAIDGDPLTDPDAIHRILAVYARGIQVVPER
ncbi:MAG: amidohydrolase family protein [Kineosporiaceae bacterium]